MPPPYHPGQIVWAPVLAPQDRNLKERPCVVVGCNEALVAVVGVTSTLTDIDPADRVDLPHSNDPLHPCHTGLRRPSAAHCNWQEVVRIADVRSVMGYVADADFGRIVARVRELAAARKAAGSDTST